MSTQIAKIGRILLVLLAFYGLSGCSIEPWVKPYERDKLADPIMALDGDPVSLVDASSQFADIVKKALLHQMTASGSRRICRASRVGSSIRQAWVPRAGWHVDVGPSRRRPYRTRARAVPARVARATGHAAADPGPGSPVC